MGTGCWALGSQGRSRGEAVALTARRWQSLDPTACQAHPLLLLQGLFSKPDPLLELHRINDDQSKQLVYRTEVRDPWPAPRESVKGQGKESPRPSLHLPGPPRL